MSNTSPYKDNRTEFFQKHFDSAKSYQEYLETADPTHSSKWITNNSSRHLTEEQIGLIGSFTRRLNLLVLSGVWCGDCVRQGPLLNEIASHNSLIDLRFFESRQTMELDDELRVNGAQKVPVVVGLSEDFFELGRFGDAHLSVYRDKLSKNIGTSCDSGLGISDSTDKLKIEITEWLSWIERQQYILRLSPMLRRRYED